MLVLPLPFGGLFAFLASDGKSATAYLLILPRFRT